MNINYYIKRFNFPKFEVADYTLIRKSIESDFLQALGNSKTLYYRFNDFQQALYSVMNLIDKLHDMTHGKFNADRIWQTIFALYIQPIGITYFERYCYSDKFSDMIYFYNASNVERRKSMMNDIISKKIDANDNQLLLFMGLSFPYTENQLKKRFRKLALEFHPDKHGGDSQKFIYLKNCYDVLKKNF
jgi:hypothetical protein